MYHIQHTACPGWEKHRTVLVNQSKEAAARAAVARAAVRAAAERARAAAATVAGVAVVAVVGLEAEILCCSDP